MTRSIVVALGLALGLMLPLGGCGSDDEPKPASSTGTPTAPDAPDAPTPTAPRPEIVFAIGDAIEVEHDYDQHFLVPVRNDGPGLAGVRIRARAPEELPTGIVGRGTAGGDQGMALGIPEGETWQVPMLVHADHATQSEYTVTLEAVALDDEAPLATKALQVRVKSPELRLKTLWRTPGHPLAKARLVKVLRIRNEGANVSDLSVAFAPAEGVSAAAVQLRPVVERTRLLRGGQIEVEVSPRLHPAFREAAGEIVLTGLGKEVRLPYRQVVPDGHAVYVTLSRCTCRVENNGVRCANCEKVEYGTDATPGTPVDPGAGGFERPSTPDEDETDEDYGWTGGETEGEDEELPAFDVPELSDEGIFDHGDANTEGTEDGELPPDSTGGPPPFRDRPLGEPAFEEEPDASRSTTRESRTHVDDEGRRTHMVRRRRPDGDHLNFAFGIQPGARKRVPVAMGHRVHQPSLGPSPDAAAGGAVVTYAKDTPEGGRVIEVFDPRTGTKVSIGDPTGKAESPKLVRVGDHVELLYRVDGELKRARVADDLSAMEPINWPPPGTRVGRLLEAGTTPDGQPFVISVADGEVFVDAPSGRETFEGTHADAAVTKGGERWLALRKADGRIVAVGPDGTFTPLVDPSPDNGPPALLRTRQGGARLFFHRRLVPPDETPEEAVGLALGGSFAIEYADGAWGEPRRILLPEMPVDVAAVVLSMRLPYGRQHYAPMNMRIDLNGTTIGRIEQRIPQGRYVYRIPPQLLRYASGAGTAPDVGNRVTLHISGIGRGHFHVTDSCALYTRNRLLQDCLVAKTAAEAEAHAQASVAGTRHDAPDLVVASNGWELPRDAQPGQEIAAKIGLFNAGDRPVPAGTLHWSIGGEVTGSAPHPELAPFRGRTLTVPVRIPDTWQAGTDLKLTVRASVAKDADPATNTLDFVIMKALVEKVAGPTGPAEVDVKQLPEDAIAVVDLEVGEPYEAALDRNRRWYRAESVGDQVLDVEIEGPDQDRVRDVRLFLEDVIVDLTDETRKDYDVELAGPVYVPVTHVYVRLDFEGDGPIAEGTVIRLLLRDE